MSRRRTRIDGERSRERILETAAMLAAAEGLEGLSLARLAREARMSKSGVFGLFGSKEELQMATVGWARRVFAAEVVAPAMELPAGTDRLLALCEGFLDYVERRRWPVGCFFATVAAEVGGRPGPLRDRVAADQRQWVELLARNARLAEDAGQLGEGGTADRVAAELSTMLTGADLAYLLHGDVAILDRIRAAIRDRVGVAGVAAAARPGAIESSPP